MEIGGQSNDFVSAVGQCWMYSVNGELGKVGCGVYKLKPRDIVRWEFTIVNNSASL
jgi:hypothetical protein